MVEIMIPDITTIVTQFVLIGGLILGAVKWLESKSEKKATRAKEEALQTANELKKLAGETATEVREYSDKVNTQMAVQIREIDKKVMEMLSDLRKRADLTNGNVSSIRTDIADLQEDIQMVFDDKAEAVTDDEMMVKNRKREQDKRRRNKRRVIERDRIDQSERSLSRDR